MPSTKATTAFCGLPLVNPTCVPDGTIAAVLGAPCSLGTPHQGTENAPFFLRTVSKSHTWPAAAPQVFDVRHGIEPLDQIVDIGDLDFGSMTLDEALAATEIVVRGLPDGVVPCVIGGDHTVTLAIVRALKCRRNLPFSVVQFDHHLDLQIWDGAPANPAAQREPIFNTNVMSHVSDCVGPGRLVQIGVSPFATVEVGVAGLMPGYLATLGRQVPITAPEIDDADAFLATVGSGQDLYLTIDVDVLACTEMSSTGYPAEIGLSTRDLLRLIDLVTEHNTLVGFDLVEFAADRTDRTPKTLGDAQRAALIFLHLLSCTRRQAPLLASQ